MKSIRDKLFERSELLSSSRGYGAIKYERLIGQEFEKMEFLAIVYKNLYELLLNFDRNLSE